MTDLRRLAEDMMLALGHGRYEYVPDADGRSVYTKWVAACSPEVILALLDVRDAARGMTCEADKYWQYLRPLNETIDTLYAALDRLDEVIP
jgi:hypothetical protein